MLTQRFLPIQIAWFHSELCFLLTRCPPTLKTNMYCRPHSHENSPSHQRVKFPQVISLDQDTQFLNPIQKNQSTFAKAFHKGDDRLLSTSLLAVQSYEDRIPLGGTRIPDEFQFWGWWHKRLNFKGFTRQHLCFVWEGDYFSRIATMCNI